MLIYLDKIKIIDDNFFFFLILFNYLQLMQIVQ